MWNHHSIDEVSKSTFSDVFCKPLYESYCFSRIPATIKYLLTGKDGQTLPKDCFRVQEDRYDMVVLLLLDAFGWSFFEKRALQYPFLSRFVQEGIVSKITTQFPSTTAAHVTTINVGQEVGQTGVYEWFYYEPKVDQIIAPLMFSIAGAKTLGNIEKLGITPKDIFPNSTFYLQLKKQGIDSYLVQPENIIHSAYSKAMSLGAHPISYYRLEEGLKTVVEAMRGSATTKSYFMIYFPDIDAAGHRHGVESKEFDEVIDGCMQTLEQFFIDAVNASNKKVALLVTADHGMVPVDPKNTYFINKQIPQLTSLIKLNKQGLLLAPAGSCRDLFFHFNEDSIDEGLSLLKEHLEGVAECYRVSELIDLGFFGKAPVSEEFLSRVGNVVVLPFKGQAVWWYEKGKFEQHFYGAHGGLTRDEAESIFLFQEIGPANV